MLGESKLIVNTFSSYDLSEEEARQGAILTDLQTQVIQNRLATIAEEKLNLEFDTANPQSYIQQEAYKRGELDALTFILADSEAALFDPIAPDSDINPF